MLAYSKKPISQEAYTMIKNNFNANLFKLSSFLLIIVTLTNCKKDTDFSEPQSSSSNQTLSLRANEKALTGIISTSYYIERALPVGYVKDGTKDYTSYIQAAITRNSNLVFPAFPLMINSDGLEIGSNKTLTFLTGSKLVLKPTDRNDYDIIRLSGVTNVTMYDPVVYGDRYKHLGTVGEAGVGIGIRGSTNITIYSPIVRECWGDGIYIGQVENTINSKNIIIKDAFLKRNRRDGISITSVDGLILDNCYAGFSDGTLPYCGINFEANSPSCVMKNIKVNNPQTAYNLGNGIQIGLKRMLGKGDRIVDFTFTNHQDTKSGRVAFKTSCYSTSTVAGTGLLYGTVSIINPVWKCATSNSPLDFVTNQSNYKMSISSPDVYNTTPTLLPWTSTISLLKAGSAGAGILSMVQ